MKIEVESAKLVLLLCFLFVFHFSNSQSGKPYENCSTNNIVKFYLIKKFKADEIKEIKINERLRKAGADHSIFIDYFEKVCFIPVDSVNKFNTLKEMLLNNLSYEDKQYFFLQSTHTQYDIKKFCSTSFEVDTTTIIKNKRYYTFRNNIEPEFIYKVYLIEAEAVYARIDNTSLNKRWLGLGYSRKEKYFDCFFIYKILNSSVVTDEHDLQEWLPE